MVINGVVMVSNYNTLRYEEKKKRGTIMVSCLEQCFNTGKLHMPHKHCPLIIRLCSVRAHYKRHLVCCLQARSFVSFVNTAEEDNDVRSASTAGGCEKCLQETVLRVFLLLYSVSLRGHCFSFTFLCFNNKINNN